MQIILFIGVSQRRLLCRLPIGGAWSVSLDVDCEQVGSCMIALRMAIEIGWRVGWVST